MDKETEIKLERCLINAAYTFAVTFTAGMASNLQKLSIPEEAGNAVLQTLLASAIAFGSTFCIAFKQVFKKDLTLTVPKMNKKGKVNNSGILLF